MMVFPNVQMSVSALANAGSPPYGDDSYLEFD